MLSSLKALAKLGVALGTSLRSVIGSLLRRAEVAYVLLSSLLVAWLWWALAKRGEKVKELQGLLIKAKLDKKLVEVNARLYKGKKEYEKAYDSYISLHRAYTKLTKPKQRKRGKPKSLLD